MLKDDFWQDLTEVGDAFGISLKESRIEAYWKSLKFISTEAWGRMLRLLRHGERFPTIKQVLGVYEDIRDDVPKDDPGAGDPDCPDCYGEGRLYIRRTYLDMKDATGKRIPYEVMCRCARCSRDRGNRKIAAADRDRIETNPNVIKILNEPIQDIPMPRRQVTIENLEAPIQDLDEEAVFAREERLAILEEQRRLLDGSTDCD